MAVKKQAILCVAMVPTCDTWNETRIGVETVARVPRFVLDSSKNAQCRSYLSSSPTVTKFLITRK
jgi:hypothetical protein